MTENKDIEQFKDLNVKPVSQPSILVKTGMQALGMPRLSPKSVQQYLLAHPLIPRGIEIRSNRMTGRGFKVKPRNDKSIAVEAADKMRELLAASGDEILINGWIKDAYAFGNGYLTLLGDKETGEIVYLSREHPMFFRIAREKKEKSGKNSVTSVNISGDFTNDYGLMKIDEVTKKPIAYTQVIYAKDQPDRVEPIGKELSHEQVAHLVFDTWGDEAEGIGYIQYVHLLLKYLMNIEESAAEGIYRSGFTQKKVTTDINNEKDLKKLAKNLDGITSSDAIILPKGTDVENLIPGQSEFTEVHDTFINLIAIRLGVPKPILTLDGSDINKATMSELMKDLVYDIRAEELKVVSAIENQIFKNACESIYGDDFEDVPRFEFNDFTEGKEELATVISLTGDYVKKFTDSYKILKELGAEEEAKKVLEYMINNIPVQGINSVNKQPEEDSV